MELKRKIAVVTGGGAGIGEGISLRLAEAGADVAIVDINKARADGIADKIKKSGRKSMVLVANATDSQQIQQAILNIMDTFAKIDILVNNVGGEVRFHKERTGERFIETSEQEWNEMIDLNLNATIKTCQAVVPYMVKQNSGKIVNIASVGGRHPTWTGERTSPAVLMAYGVAKAGIIQFTDLLALELAEHNINVNCVAPGAVWTPMYGKAALREMAVKKFKGMSPREYFEKVVVPGLPLKREITPSDIGDAVVFFASEKARSITGQSINIDAGVHPR